MGASALAVAVLVLLLDRPGDSAAEPSRVASRSTGLPGADVVPPEQPENVACPEVDGRPACELVRLGPPGSGGLAVVVEDTVLLPVGSDLVGVDLLDGSPRWESTSLGPERSTLVAGDDLVLAVGSGQVARLDPRSGAIRWRTAIGPAAATPRAWVLGRGILVLDAQGRLTSLRPDDGSARWEVEGIGANVEVTPSGVLVRLGTDLALFEPDRREPRWRRSDTVGHALELPPGSIAGLLSNPGRIDAATGERLRVTPGADLLVGALPPALPRIELHWEDAGTEVVALATDEAGSLRWESPPLPIPCCTVVAVPAGAQRLGLASPGGVAAVLEVATGAATAVLEEPGAALVALVGERAVWRQPTSVLVRRLPDGRVVYQAVGEVVSFEPLLVDGPSGLVHVRWDDPAVTATAPEERRSPR